MDEHRAASVPVGNGSGHGSAPMPGTPLLKVQNGWLKRMRGQAVAVRLQSGELLCGVLEGDDSYTLALRVPGHPETALVYKHSIAYLIPNPAR